MQPVLGVDPAMQQLVRQTNKAWMQLALDQPIQESGVRARLHLLGVVPYAPLQVGSLPAVLAAFLIPDRGCWC